MSLRMIRIFVMMDAIDFTGSKPPYRFPIIRSTVTGRQEQALQRASQPYHPVQSSADNKAWSGLQHAPITYDNGGQDVYSYAYDANGNQVERVTSSGTYSLTYNVENKLIEVGFAAQQGAAQGIEPLSEAEALAEPEPTPEAIEEDTETEEEQEAPPDGSLNLWERLVAFVDNLLTRMQMPGTYLSIGATVYSAQRMFQEQDPTATVEPEPTATQTATPEAEATQTETAAPDATRTQEPTPDATPELVETLEPAPSEMTEEVIQLEPEIAIEMMTTLLQSAVYVYDGDGNLVKSIVNEVVTYYAERHYHKTVDGVNVTVKKYYSIGMSQIAVRTNGELNWILTDHLSSASVIANADGTFLSEVKYTAFGEIRSGSEDMPTNYKYTGQLSQMAEVGLYHYGARFYDPLISHFISADTMVPSAGNAMDWNRYAYVRYNPINLIDPSGNRACSSDGNGLEDCEEDSIDKLIREYNLKAKYIWQPLPGVEEIGVTDDAPPKFDTMDINRRSIHYYERLRARLYISGHTDAFDETGKIHDVILISYLISGEFGDYKFYPPEDIKAALVYDAGISAISNQYFSTKTIFNGGARCKGNCTVLSQLQWVQGIEAWRNENRYNLSVKRWSEFHDDALRISLSPYKSFSTFGNPQDPSWFNRTPIFCYPLHNFCVK
jgi:RHS repeat-associated protein